MGLQGVELILCGYNTPIHYAPDPSQDILQGSTTRSCSSPARTRTARGWSAWPRAAWRRGSTRSPSRASSPRRADRRPGADDRRRADHRRLRPRLVPALHAAPCSTSTATAAPELYGRITSQRGAKDRHRRPTDGATMTTVDGRHGSFTLNGAAVAGAGRPPAPARRAARGARHHLTQGRLLAVGPVRLLHGPRRRQGRRVAASSRSTKVEGRSVTTLEGFDPDERGPLRRRVRGLRRRCSAASASPASSCGPRPRSTRRAPTSPATTWPATSAPTSAAAPAT